MVDTPKLVTQQQINDIITKLFISEAQIKRPDTIIGVLNGAKTITNTLGALLNVKTCFVKISTYRKESHSGEININIPKHTRRSIEQSKSLWIVDDIYDTGLTMKMIDSLIFVLNEHVEVKRFTLFSKQETTFIKFGELTADWIAFPWEQTR